MSERKDLAVYETLLVQLRAIRDLKAELEALKNMFFEHRPPFIQAFEQHRTQVENSAELQGLDTAISKLEQRVEEARLDNASRPSSSRSVQ
jgi:hypothetical protein